MLITEILRQNAEKYGEQSALVEVDSLGLIPGDDAPYAARRRELSWRQFNDLANRAANYYNSLGIGKGNRVGILLMNCIEWLPIYFGILKSGAVAVPLNFRYSADELAANAGRADLDALIFGAKCSPAVEAARDKLSRLRSFLYVGEEAARPAFALSSSAFAKSPADEPGVRLSAGEDAAIYFSSGTTGVPKAVVYTHGTLEAACVREQKLHGQTHDDVFIGIPPLYHVGAKLHWSGNLLKGAKGVLLLGFTVSGFFEAMARESVTIAFLLLPWIQDILLALDTGTLAPGDYDLSRWRLLHMGAQPIPPIVVEKLLEALPFLSCDISYGLTEAGGPGCLNLGSENIGRPGSVGRPAELWEARLAGDDGCDVARGEAGELLVKGPGMMRCYYKNEAATRAALAGGWLHTGDVARQDADGFYYLIDRKKDIIISGGENICPTQVEHFLRTVDGVLDAAVFGVHHDRLGEVAAAAVTLKPGALLGEEELVRSCCALPRYMRPHRFFFGEIPRNATGKIDKVRLRKIYGGLASFPDKEG